MSDSTTREIETDIGDPTDAAVEPGTAGGKLFAGIRWLRDKLMSALGTTGDASSADTVLGLIGQPADAGVTTPTEGSLYARLAKILTWIGSSSDGSVVPPNASASIFAFLHAGYDRADAAVTAASAIRAASAGTVTYRLIIPTAVVSTDDPGMSPTWVACPSVITGTTYKNAQVWYLEEMFAVPANAYVKSFKIHLHWRASIGGTGSSATVKWTCTNQSNTNGGTTTDGYDITDEQVQWPKKGAVEFPHREGQPVLNDAGSGSSRMRLCCAVKSDTAGGTCTVEICDDSYVEITWASRP